MVRFTEVFPDREIVTTLSRQLGWSYFVGIIYPKESLQRNFYAELCRIERWSVRTAATSIRIASASSAASRAQTTVIVGRSKGAHL